MQISNGTFIIDGGGLSVIPATVTLGPVSGDPSVNLGVTVNWTSNTWLYIAEGQANTRSTPFDTVNYDTNRMVYQLFYAHRSVRIPVSRGTVSATGGGARWSTIVRQGGTNTPALYGAVSGANATRTDFKSNTDTVLLNPGVSISYLANTLYQGNTTVSFTVPANRYFLLGIQGGPFYKNFKRTSNNYTAVSNGNAIVTVINEAYAAAWPSGPDFGIPTQLGGNTSSYFKLASNILLAAFKFELV